MNQKQTASVSASDAMNGSYAAVSGRAESGTTTHAAELAPAASAASQRRAPTSAKGSSTSAWKRSPGLTARQPTALAAYTGMLTVRDLLGEGEQAVGAAHCQAVGEQRFDDVLIVAVACARALGELAHERGATLPPRTLEAALAPQRRERLAA